MFTRVIMITIIFLYNQNISFRKILIIYKQHDSKMQIKQFKLFLEVYDLKN